jgi:dihydroorotase
MLERLTTGPAQVLGRPHAGLNQGAQANLTIFNPEEEWTVEATRIVSKSKNTPFLGKTLQGMVEKTIFDGRVVYST